MKTLYVRNVLMGRFALWMCVAIVAVSMVEFAEAALPARQYVESVPFTVYIQDGSFKDEDTFNDSDVYGRINFPGYSSRFTQVVSNDNTPYFNKTFSYNYNISAYGYPDTIRFDFWDDDGGLGGNDDYLGVEYVNFNLGVYPFTNARGSLTRYYFNNQWFDARITAQSMKVRLNNNQTWNAGGSLGLGTNRQFQRVTVNSGGHLTVPGTLSFANSAGIIIFNGGHLSANAIHKNNGGFYFNGGELNTNRFEGTLVNNGGTLSPGQTSGITTITGSYLPSPASRLLMKLGGTDNSNPGSLQYEKLHVNGQLRFSGDLTIQLTGGFTPSMGDQFDLLDWGSRVGAFNTMNLPALGGGLAWNTGSLHDDGVIGVTVLGDINGDSLVNGFDVDPFVDLLLNGPYNPVGDMNNDGAINGFDVDPFVAAVLGGGAVPITSDIPEPATFALLGLGLVGLRRRAKR